MNVPVARHVQNVPQGMSIRYRLTRGDAIRSHLHILSRNRMVIGFAIVSIAFCAWGSFKPQDLAGRSPAFTCFFVVGLLVIWGSLVVLFSTIAITLSVLLQKYGGVVCEHVLEITEAGLVERTDTNESLSRWAGFHKVHSTRSYLYIYVTDVKFYTVPKRAFANEIHARAFQDEIVKRWKGS